MYYLEWNGESSNGTGDSGISLGMGREISQKVSGTVEMGGMRFLTESEAGRTQSGKKREPPGPLLWEDYPGHFISFSKVVRPPDDPQIHVDKSTQGWGVT